MFLGIMLDGNSLILSIPMEKRVKALKMLNNLVNKRSCTVKQLQELTGYLNFLTKAIHPGRAFTRRIYAKYEHCLQPHGPSEFRLRHYHHVRLDQEFRFDCEVWRIFLNKAVDKVVCRPMIDLSSGKNCTYTSTLQ